MKQAIAFAATLAATLCCLQCSTLTGGTGEETTNGRITGKLVAVDGLPASGTQVTLLPVLYDPTHFHGPRRVITISRRYAKTTALARLSA
jgi:hypothetical protein